MPNKLSTFLLALFSAFALFHPPVSEAHPAPTLRQKIGQMLMVGFRGKELAPDAPILKAIRAGEVGGVILFDYDFQTKTFNHNIESPSQLQKLTHELQSAATAPLLIGIDYEGGKVNRLKSSYDFPEVLSAAALAKLGDTATQKQAAQMAETLNEAGINLDFAPVIDVNINPDNPIIGRLDRSFSADPSEVSHFAKIFSDAFSARHILCAYKHFPGHGSSTADSHLGFVDVTETWQPKELIPYETLLNTKDSCSFVMIAHVIHHGLDEKDYPASLSKKMITGLLRKKLHFNGVVITDDLQMKAITDQYGAENAALLAINAGADMLIFGNQLVPEPVDPAVLVNSIYEDVLAGKIKRSRIEESWRRIMHLKHRMQKNKTNVN